jgi:hypothetical protein
VRHACDDDPLAKLDCEACGGLGEEPATKKTAARSWRPSEQEYVDFRLDDPSDASSRYPSSLGASFSSPG